ASGQPRGRITAHASTAANSTRDSTAPASSLPSSPTPFFPRQHRRPASAAHAYNVPRPCLR
ncbi:MAG: hypothetical protein K2Q25_08175, partial [Mycobacteriaceae bacterium]|nr:hypothetical protein [Mycobacteriaceae bacterium]